MLEFAILNTAYCYKKKAVRKKLDPAANYSTAGFLYVLELTTVKMTVLTRIPGHVIHDILIALDVDAIYPTSLVHEHRGHWRQPKKIPVGPIRIVMLS